MVHRGITDDAGLVNIADFDCAATAAFGDEEVEPINDKLIKLSQFCIVAGVCDSGYDVVTEFRLGVKVGCGCDYSARFHIDNFDNNGGRAYIDSQANDGSFAGEGEIFFVNIRRGCIGSNETFG
jgi:hypothetical protein